MEHCAYHPKKFTYLTIPQTTTIARAVSNMDPTAFYDRISKEADEHCTIEGLTIGHTAVSTTVVPKVYHVNDFHICDMPGFSETNPQKRISIDILQKCFLTKVQTATFLVVVDMHAILQTKLETLMQQYDVALSNLLGDQYQSTIDHLYFVITKNQQLRKTQADVRNTLGAAALDLLGDNPVGARLLVRLSKHNVIVDLQKDNNVTLMRKIKHMVEKDEALSRTLHRRIDWKIEKLKAGENRLNRLCLRNIEALTRQKAGLKAKLEQQRDVAAKTKAELAKETAAVCEARNLEAQSYQEVSYEMEGVTKELDLHDPTKQQLLTAIKDTEDLLEVHRRQSALFAKHFIEGDFIYFRCDVSKRVDRRMGQKPEYRIALTADVTSDNSKDRVVLVMEHEEHDDTLKEFINREGSLFPKHLDDIRNIELASVLYNSHNLINRCNAQLIEMDQQNGTGIVSLEIRRNTPFKVYIYSCRPFKELHFFEDFKTHFDEDLVQDEARIVHLKQKLKSLEQKRVFLVKKQKELREKQAISKDAVEQLKNQAKMKLRLHREVCKKVQVSTQSIELELQKIKENDKILRIAEINEIFRANNIESALGTRLGAFQADFGPIEKVIAEVSGFIRRFEEENEESLTGVMLAGLESNYPEV